MFFSTCSKHKSNIIYDTMYTIHRGDGGQHTGEERGLKSQNSKGNATSLGNRKVRRKKSSERKTEKKNPS